MTSVTQLADRCQLALNDVAAGTWPQLTLEQWVWDACRDYSQYFPRVKTATTLISKESEAVHEQDLPSDFISAILVECPTGEDPPAYLQRRARTRSDFWDVPGYYDLEPSGDANTEGVLYLSEAPEVLESWKITYMAPHNTGADGNTLTVPSEHEELLVLFVLWRAHAERQATAEQDPDTTLNVLQQLVKAAVQAEAEYRSALERAETHRSQSAWTGPWRADIYDPIY